MAAGEGSRMRPLTDTTAKPLLKICWKTLIEHNIESIISEFDEIFFIVKYKKEQFSTYFGTTYHWKPVHYIVQMDEKSGTGAAILSLDGKISGGFLVVSGDDLYASEDILSLRNTPGYSILAKAVDRPEDFGIFSVDDTGKLTGIIEKPTDPSSGNLANIGVFKLDDQIFPLLHTLPLSPRGELEITDLMQKYIEEDRMALVEAKGKWITIGYPWDLLKANNEIIGNYSETLNKWAIIEPNVSINWNIYLEEGVIIKSGTSIEWNVYFGKWSVIGPNAYIRWNTSIGESTKVGFSVECKNSYIGDHSSIPHLSYIGDSIIGNDVNIGGNSMVANLRHDAKNIRVMIKDKLVDTGHRKLGVIIGDGAHLGIGTIIYPGRIISSNGTTLPGEIIR